MSTIPLETGPNTINIDDQIAIFKEQIENVTHGLNLKPKKKKKKAKPATNPAPVRKEEISSSKTTTRAASKRVDKTEQAKKGSTLLSQTETVKAKRSNSKANLGQNNSVPLQQINKRISGSRQDVKRVADFSQYMP